METCTYHYAVWQEFFEAKLEQSFSFEAKDEVNCDTGIYRIGVTIPTALPVCIYACTDAVLRMNCTISTLAVN